MLTQHKHREHAGRSELPLLRQQLSFSLNCFICSYWHNAENHGSSRPQPRWGKQLEAPLTPSIEATVQYSFTWHTTIEATVEYSLTRQGTIEATEKKTQRGAPAPLHSITPLRSYQRQNPGYSQFNQISSNWIMRWQSTSTSPPHMLDGWSKKVMKQDHYTQSKITLLSSHIICRGHFYRK